MDELQSYRQLFNALFLSPPIMPQPKWHQDAAFIGFTIDRLVNLVERYANHLHAERAHPDYEYCTTVTGRKTSENPRDKLVGDGWEPNNSCTYMVDGEVIDDSWERFDYHEEYYWRRKK